MSSYQPYSNQTGQPSGYKRAFRLRPLGVGEIMDESLELYRRHFKTFIGVIALPAVPFYLLMALALPPMYYYINQFSGTAGRDPAPEQVFTFLGAILLFMLILTPVWWAMQSFQLGASTTAVSDAYLGQQASIKDSLKRVLKYTLPLLGAQFTVGLLLAIGFFALMILLGFGIGIIGAVAGRGDGALAVLGVLGLFAIGIVGGGVLMLALVTWFLFVTQAVVVEGKGVSEAISRSIELVKGNFWRVLGIYLLILIITSFIQGIIGQIVNLPLQFLFMNNPNPSVMIILQMVNWVVGTVVGLLVWPFTNSCVTLLYYDLRIRKEGFDLEMLSREMGYGETVRPQFDL